MIWNIWNYTGEDLRICVMINDFDFTSRLNLGYKKEYYLRS